VFLAHAARCASNCFERHCHHNFLVQLSPESVNAKLIVKEAVVKWPTDRWYKMEVDDDEHWRRAAEAGDVGAQFNLGLMYAQGRGVKKSLGEVSAPSGHIINHAVPLNRPVE